MPIKDAMLPEFDREMTATRTVLERTPEAHAAWKPHPKSYRLGALALHLTNLPSWATFTLKQTELDLNPPGGAGYKERAFQSVAELLRVFDENVRAAREAIDATSDADFMVPWSLKNAGATIFTMPRVVVMRSFVMNHLFHHRGQFTVYLRLRDVPLPVIYGPTADEGA